MRRPRELPENHLGYYEFREKEDLYMNNNLKKMLSLALVITMALSCMVIMPLTASAAERTTIGGGDGLTIDTPYVISSDEDLMTLRTLAWDTEQNPRARRFLSSWPLTSSLRPNLAWHRMFMAVMRPKS